ncbi:reverse transcriptase family protein, partial [Listeria welshimeri]|nr:reverse transcriptase family protein [Listeria welshimeri]
MKHSKIIPLFKSGNTSDLNNFRPISVLPTLSKIFEKIILNQMLAHFINNKLLHEKQFGFTKGRSTTDAGVELVKNIFEAWEESHNALGIFCDLSKAFDCVQHSTLVSKLRHYGIRGSALDLLMSYLDKRIQKIDVNGKRSPGAMLDMGVPQGSILGPFLFLIYINDLPYLVEKKHKIVLFADDTSLIFKVKRNISNYDEVNNALSDVVHWFSVNNLKLNCKKTQYIKFTTPNVKNTQTSVFIDGEKMEPVESTVFLGITVDSKLQWGPHIEKLANKLSSAVYAIKKIRKVTDVETARLVYFSYFHSIMSYGILLWGHAADINTIFVLQKRAIRAVYSLSPKESLREKFKEINILTVASQFILENVMYVHRNIDRFTKNCDIHQI